MVVLFLVILFQKVDSTVLLVGLRTKWASALFLRAKVKKVWPVLWEKLYVCVHEHCTLQSKCLQLRCTLLLGKTLWTWSLGLVWTDCIPQGNVESLKVVVFCQLSIASEAKLETWQLRYGTLDPFCVVVFSCASYIDYGIKSCCTGINLIRDALLWLCFCNGAGSCLQSWVVVIWPWKVWMSWIKSAESWDLPRIGAGVQTKTIWGQGDKF